MNIQEETQNGLYYRTWKAKQATAAVILVHGLGEHCQRYDHVAKALTNKGYSLYSMDLPGHGKSTGPRGHIDGFSDYLKATETLLERAEDELPQAPKFILGHSMGGLIVSQFLLEHQDRFRGAMLSGPAIQSTQEPPAWQVALIKGIARVFPTAKMLALDASGVSRDPKVVTKYNADPLVDKSKLSAKFLVSLTEAMDKIKQRANEITLPILLMHGSEDSMTSPEGTDFLYNNCKSTDKEKHILDGLFHEIFNEPEQDTVIELTLNWLVQRSD